MSDNPLWKMFLPGTGSTIPKNAPLAAEWQRQWNERHASNWVIVGEPGLNQKMVPR